MPFSLWLRVMALLLSVCSVPAAPDPERQSEKDWVDSRWSQTEIGPFLASTVHLPNGVVTKGLAIRIGDHEEATVCYDTGAGLLRAGWTGGFLKPDPARYGLIRWPKVSGELRFLGPQKISLGENRLAYGGLRLHGKRVILEWQAGARTVQESPWFEIRQEIEFFTRTFEISEGAPVSLEIFNGKKHTVSERTFGEWSGLVLKSNTDAIAMSWMGDKGAELVIGQDGVMLRFAESDRARRGMLVIWNGPAESVDDFAKVVAGMPPHTDLSAWKSAGPPRWLPEIETRGQPGFGNSALVIDTLTVPYENPWKALMFLSGVDFLSNGTAYVSSIHGDVWRVSGIDESMRNLRWKRFATGLFQPLGLKILNGRIHVLGRDQITELVDENGDGEADVYRNFCDLIETSPGGHDYVTCLEADAAGNLYYVDPRGVHRVSADGKSKETIAIGWRNPNGLGVSPYGIVTVAPQQGEWTPSSAIYEVRPGSYYGYGGPRITPERPLGYDEPLLWLPHSIDNSSGSQVWVPPNQWGPLGGQMLHLVWGRCSMMLVLRDVVNGQPHGAAIPLPGRFLSGPMRGTFSPFDGHLYVAGSTGWQTSAVKDGCLQRVRYLGKALPCPIAFHVRSHGLEITFAQPLSRDTAEDIGSYSLMHWNYKYAKDYGSDDWSVAEPSEKKRDTLELRSAKLSADNHTVSLEIPGLRPVMQLEVKYNLNTADGKSLRSALYTTIH